MRVLYWIIAIPVAVLITVFAVSNRAAVTLSLWPLPYELELPLFLPIMVALLVGLGIGLAYEWLVNSKHRRAARRMDSELKRVKAEDETPKADQSNTDHKALGHS
ncbi:LapA family protein [Thalassospira lucentensis]|uniref:LapA family protein n=1 Tax=Thalassospira lucentensis TaxID=168935 RepID=UPI00142E12C1|nr:LapA family protein [Thalassospira lucentensis]NIZ00928.1 LapA family protein [Thalassospira lucentensis]